MEHTQRLPVTLFPSHCIFVNVGARAGVSQLWLLWNQNQGCGARARSRSPSNFAWLEPEAKNFRWWSRSL